MINCQLQEYSLIVVKTLQIFDFYDVKIQLIKWLITQLIYFHDWQYYLYYFIKRIH